MKEDKKNSLKQKIRNAAYQSCTDARPEGQEEIPSQEYMTIEYKEESSGQTAEEPPVSEPALVTVTHSSDTETASKAVKGATVNKVREKEKSEKVRVKPQKAAKRVKVVKEKHHAGKKINKRMFTFGVVFILCCVLILSGIVVAGQVINSKRDTIANAQSGSDAEAFEIRTAGEDAIEKGDLKTSEDGVQDRLNELAEDSRVYCIISSSPYFEDSKSKGALFISNPKESKYYTQVIIKTENGTEMYISPLLAPDEKIEYDYLTNTNFENGSYDAYAYFNYYSNEDSSSYLGSMCAQINVIIGD